MSQIAVVRLAPGQAGYYDELSGIYLTAGKPVAGIPSGTNSSFCTYGYYYFTKWYSWR